MTGNPELESEVLSGLAKVLTDVRAASGLPARFVVLDDSLVDDLGIDSIALVDLAVGLEEHFGIGEFPLEDWIHSQVVGDARKFTVRSLLNATVELAQRSRR